ncbi:plant virulence effector HPE1-like domain-containing protein [Ensifer sp. 4252]|uniref:plant virulence effector HPE1-like domain-containing protein n=1 Tax=Ensifer sp. 4252 TaxID=3373915 RepID=UPI003D1DDDDD
MRLLLITTAVALAAGSAWASSIEAVVSGDAVNSSVASVSCAQCPPLQIKKKVTYVVPEIENGSEKVELKQINGEMKLVRTEAWLGGSPVVFVSKPSEDILKAAASGTEQVDMATTAAVQTITQPEQAIAASMAAESSRQFDPSALELRLN